MSLFDKLKKATSGQLGDALGKAIEGVTKATAQFGAQEPSRPQAAPQSVGRAAPGAPAPHAPFAPAPHAEDAERRFGQILAEEFADLQVVKEAAPGSIGISAPNPCRPYSYALLRGGRPVMAIMLTPHNRDRNSAFLNARKAAQGANIAFLNFYTHFPNERGYVVSRIKSAL